MSSLNQYGEQFLNDMNKNNQEQPQNKKPKKELFEAKSVNEWLELADKEDDQKRLLGDLWYENELCVLFSSSNVGKSVLAVQIADALSKGTTIMPMVNEAPAQKVLYFDFELTMKQFAKRCVGQGKDGQKVYYSFNKNFVRVEHNPQEAPSEYKSPEAYLLLKMRETIIKHKAKIIIIDNLTMMNSDNNDNKRTKQFVCDLKAMKDTYGLSILMIGHSKKKNIAFEPLSDADLYGSSMLFNFIDSCFGIGKGRNEERYIKHFKTRNGEIAYTHRNVPVYSIQQVKGLVMFVYTNIKNEHSLLNDSNEISNDKIIELYDDGKGMTPYKIAKEHGLPMSSVYRTVKLYKEHKAKEAERLKYEKAEQERHDEEFQQFLNTLNENNRG